MANIATLSVSLVARTQQFETALDKSLKKLKKFQGSSSGGGVAGVGQQVQQAQNKITGFISTAGKVGAALGGAFAVRQVGLFVGALARADSKLDLFRAQMRELGGEDITVEAVAESANRVGISFDQAASSIVGFLLAGRRLKLTNAEVLELNENIGILGRLGGRSGQEIASAMTQFQQALAKGKPDAIELKSIMVGLPLVAESLAQKLGVGTEELLNLNSKGKITSEILADAVLNAERLAGEESALSKMPETVETINNKLATATLRLLGSVNASKLWTAPIGAIAAGFDKVREGIEFLKDPINARKAETKALLDEIKALDEELVEGPEKRREAAERRLGAEEKPLDVGARGQPAFKQVSDALSRGLQGARGDPALQNALESAGKIFAARPAKLAESLEAAKGREDRTVRILESLNQTQLEQLEIIKRRKADPKFDATFG